MNRPPLDRLDEILPADVRAIVERPSSIPTISVRAGAIKRDHPDLVRGDIGQIVGVDPAREVLYGPPVGLDAMRDCIAETWSLAMDIDPPLARENVTVCTGAAEGLALVLRCFAAGRAVGIPRGFWENYTNAVELAGGTSVVVDFFDADGELAIEGLRRAVREHDLAVLLANFPSNPSGAVLDGDEARRIAELAREEGILLLADEVYARLRFDGVKPVSLLSYAPGHVVSVYSASKEYLVPGARTGFVLSPRPDLTDRVLRKLLRAGTASPNVLGQRLVLERMQPDLEDLRAGREPAFVSRVRDEMKTRRDALLEVLARHQMSPVGRAGRQPEGTIFLMAALPPWWNGDDVEFSDRALDDRLFSVIPGSSFGLAGSVRFSYGSMMFDDIARLDAALATFRDSI